MFNLLNHHTIIGFVGLYGILLTATVFIYLFRNKLSFNTSVELKNRVKTWFFIITGMLVGLSYNSYFAIFIFCIVSLYAFHEYIGNIKARHYDKSVIAFSYIMIPVQFIWIAIQWNSMALIFIPVYMFLSIPVFLIVAGQTQGFLKSIGMIYWGFMASVFCLSHVALLFGLKHPENATYNTASLIFFVLFLTGINDVLQYIWGKTFGKRKILPEISPNKTLAGLIGGVCSTIVLAAIISPYLTPFTFVQSLGAGLIIGLGGFLGDVCMSAIKRDLGVKDYSNFLPGHGGILDRLDSLIYTAPLFFHYMCYLHY